MDPERTRVIHRDLNRTYPTVVRGEGIYLYDDAGKRYIDGSGGSAAVTAIGHGVPEVVEAISAQAARIAYAPTHAFSTEAIEECARIIVEAFAPAGFSKVWFVSAVRRRPTTRSRWRFSTIASGGRGRATSSSDAV
jgi:adenosylmethionine-8-amino-7-oxononanoate aminotransferase